MFSGKYSNSPTGNSTVTQPRGSFRDVLILFAYLSIDLW